MKYSPLIMDYIRNIASLFEGRSSTTLRALLDADPSKLDLRTLRARTMDAWQLLPASQFPQGVQHCASECIVQLLSLVHSEAPQDHPLRLPPWLSWQTHITTCLVCSEQSFSHPAPIWIMEVGMVALQESLSSRGCTENHGMVTVADVLEHEFSESSQTTDEFKCWSSTCKGSSVDSRRSVRITDSDLPRVLLVSLKRTGFVNGRAAKVSFPVIVTETLADTFRPKAEGGSSAESRVPCRYHLKAVVCHLGGSADCGHDVCYARHPTSPAAWFLHDDNKVSSAVAGKWTCVDDHIVCFLAS
jgi:uncharacterized UBP type Zn finger protein